MPHLCSRVALQENLDWADLTTIDLSLYGTPEGRKELAQTLIKAVREDGFFYVKNFNISQECVNRQFAIGKRFYDIPLEEKLKYVPEGLGGSIPEIHRVCESYSAQMTASSTAMCPQDVVCRWLGLNAASYAHSLAGWILSPA